MEVEFRPDLQAKLDAMARLSGHSPSELVEDSLSVYLDEFALARETLDRRFDDLESGCVQLIDGEEACERLMAKTEEQRRSQRPA